MNKSKQELEEIARAIGISTYLAYTTTLVGNPAPITTEYRDRVKDVRVGDMVVEVTTILMSVTGGHYRAALDAVGHLVKITQEPVVFSAGFVWDEKEEGRPHPTETCTYIKTLDGREYRWTNASFISVPTEYPVRENSHIPTA